MCFTLCCLVPISIARSVVCFLLFVPLCLFTEVGYALWWMCPNLCFGLSVVWNSPRLQCDARLFGLLIAPLVPVLWLFFNFIDGFIQAWLIGFVFTFNEAWKTSDPFETKVMEEWERVMGEAKHYNKQGFKDNFGEYLLPLPEGEKKYGCITLCCDSCVCGCILNLLSLLLFWICGLLIMVIDIFACLLIYIFKLPEMLIFGWCRGCGELSGLFKWYNEQRNKHGAASCCACFADCYMSCACLGYGAYYALYPFVLVLYIVIVPFWAMSVSCRSTWVSWVTEDIPESLSNCYDARWLLWASFYNMCCQMAKKDVDENARVDVVIDGQRNNNQGYISHNQPNPEYQPPAPTQPQNQGKKNRKNEATNFLSAATNGGMFLVGAAIDQIKQNREKKHQKKNGARQKPTRQQQARNGFGFYHKQPAQNPAYSEQQQPAQNPPYNPQQQPAQNQSYNQQYQQQPNYNQHQQYQQQPNYNQNQQYQQQPNYNQNQQYQQQPPPNKNIYEQQQPAQQQPADKKEYGEDKTNASRVQAAGNMFGNLVGNAVIGLGNAIKGDDDQPNKKSNI